MIKPDKLLNPSVSPEIIPIIALKTRYTPRAYHKKRRYLFNEFRSSPLIVVFHNKIL